MLEKHGYEGVTMRALADDSRVSVPTLYNLFGGKDQLLLAAVEEQFTQLLASATQQSRDGRSGDCLAVIEAMNGQLSAAPLYSRSMIQMFLLAPSTRLTSARMAAALAASLSQVLGGLSARGVLAPWVDVQSLAQRLTSHYLGSVMTWASTMQDEETLRAVTVYEACCTLMAAVADEDERSTLQSHAQRVQPLVAGAFKAGLPPALVGPKDDDAADAG